MKIGIDCRMIKATGIGRYTSNLIEELAKIDSKNDYVLFLKKEEFDSFRVPGNNFIKVLADFHWYGLSEQLKFPPLLKKYNLDFMHFPHFNVPIFYKGKFIVTIHDLTLHRYKTVRSSTKNLFTYQLKHLLYKIIIKKAIKKSQKILTPSNFTKIDIIKTFNMPEDKIIVTYEGGLSSRGLVAKPDHMILRKLKIKNPYILYVGNAYPHKNLENLVKSLKYSPKNLDLVFVGKMGDFYNRIKNTAQEESLGDRIIFSGFVTDAELVALYKKASVYAFPSLNEGFGLPPLEAMAYGLPVVSSNRSCLPEILEEAVLYFNPQDPRDISRRISEVLGDNGLRKELISKGREQVKKYSWLKMAKQTLKVYEEVLLK